jgi:Flp pilus assembly protein TadG
MSRIERAMPTRLRRVVDGEPGQQAAREGHRPTRLHPGARHGRRGQSLVEFAVILPVFLLILAGIIDFGLGLYSQMTVINAAREGARLGVVEPGNIAGIDARVQAMSAGLDKSRLTVDISCQRPVGTSFTSCSAPQWQSGDAVVVSVQYDYRMLFPLAFGNSINLASTVQMRIE